MALNGIEGFWHGLISGWSVRARITLAIVLSVTALSTAVVVVSALVLLIFERGENVEFGPFKVTQPETPREKNCRLATEEARVWDQNISNEILALEAQVAAKDHELSEIRTKCLIAQASLPHPANYESRCRTEISTTNGFVSSYSMIPRGDYETALTTAAQDRDDVQSKIAAKEQLRTQRRL